ncbi:tRNA wybutosine-synthesizing protein 3 homolog isoform X2 [Bufo bufo]|nr:tRNA wybutosine-synthesizing protein 3 homolog isoform X2 [Bufo bufo]XP_040264536.1 tRNA wybutosine-synthesizing protein 3 homolog isoform X2 [Bufo bufo]XP_040264537.1 tRNA wybutosine-synthesizing protein 3 homolog isoform X2 [Bufo bufo]XP_040264539.1 tRNA wybutosine-synthesizing protein 3 homolog isoform X2 [Bufo bufo]XP_040264540.1 tRNA wybutosine-synthesizing protein 3 homolog isoform X2 [Bufo bufo]
MELSSPDLKEVHPQPCSMENANRPISSSHQDTPRTPSSSESLGLFMHWKVQASCKTDLSKKGSVDKAIEEIVRDINLQDCYFTTSSCSGRIILIDENPDVSVVQKQNCSWLFVTHDLCTKDDVFSGLQKAFGDAVLKFEPFVLHVQCRRLEDAQLLHSVAINSGFRNSGITVGKKAKIIMAVRSTHCLEVPLSHKAKCLVSEEYIDFLVQTANQKMEENKKRIVRFYSCLQTALHKRNHVSDAESNQTSVRPVYTRRRRKQYKRRDADQCEDSVDDEETSIPLFHDMTL